MSKHTATVEWERNGSVFTDNRYSRVHRWSFDGGATIRASSSPAVVRAPLSDPAAVDPEEAFVAALSSCHMLWFLGLAAKEGFVVDHYADHAEGHMTKLPSGGEWISRVVLHPAVSFTGPRAPSDAEVHDLHHRAHAACFLASSVKSEIVIDGTWRHEIEGGLSA